MPPIDPRGVGLVASLAVVVAAGAACGQALDLSHGGPVTVTALGGIDWDQAAQTVTAHDDARAVRGDVTVTADTLIAHYRKKQGAKAATPTATPASTATSPSPVVPPPAAPAIAAASDDPKPPASPNAAPDDTGNNEIYRLNAEGHVHIFTQTDQAWGDHAVYDIDQATLVLTGDHLKLTTPQDLMLSRDSMEYYSQKHMAVGRGNASVTSTDGRRIRADTLVGYFVDNTAPPGKPGAPPPPRLGPKPGPKETEKPRDDLAASGKLQRVEAFGHVEVRTALEIVTGDRGVYVPDTGLARIVGHVHVTRGENQLNGAAAIVNMRTGLATMTETPGARVHGLVVPNEPQPHAAGTSPDQKPGTAQKSGTDDTAKDSQ